MMGKGHSGEIVLSKVVGGQRRKETESCLLNEWRFRERLGASITTVHYKRLLTQVSGRKIV
jgi:hypothetical protein